MSTDEASCFERRKKLLSELSWGAAKEFSPQVVPWVKEYYQRLLPLWPETVQRLPPGDLSFEQRTLEQRTEPERIRIKETRSELVAGLAAKKISLARTSAQLVTWMLAWAIACDVGELTPQQDPSDPLLKLFAAGYLIESNHAGIQLEYQSGWNIMQVPTRAQVVAWQQAQ